MKTYKRNYFVYFYAYFAAQVIFIYVNVYLPVYFFNVLNINRTELAFIQLFAYSALFIKPIIAIYFDKVKSTKKILVIASSFGILVSYIFLIFNLNYLLIFGIFLGLNFACISIIDVVIDKTIVEFSPDEKSKDKNATCTQLGAITGAIFPNIIAFLIFTNIYSIPIWDQFFLIGIFAIFPLIFIGFIIKDNSYESEVSQESHEKEIDLKSILLICIILFLFYGERIFEYPFEPWVLEKFGAENLSLFLFLLLLLILLNALGVLLAGMLSNKLDRKKILFIASLLYGILLIIVPFTDIITFFILLGIIQILAGFIVINIIALMIDFSQKKVIYFQIMASFVFLSYVIFIPLGTYLSAYIATELIIVIAGLLKLFSLIPIYFIKYNKKKPDVIEST